MARLFIPGPTDVAPEILEAQAQPMVGHRSQAFYDLFDRIQPNLRRSLLTEQRVLITASSGTGLQEAAVRNCVNERLLVCVCGAFGERWFKVAMSNGVPVDRIDAEFGHPNLPDEVENVLKGATYDALAIVHNETSTGIENPVAEIAKRARSIHPDILILVDAVSSAGGAKIETDAWGLDVLLTSSQKCFALPPGLGFAAVSDKALVRARTIEHRGWYFDFLMLEKYMNERHSTPATPAISLLYALDAQLDRMLAEGIENRFQRHIQLAERVQGWAREKFDLVAAEGYRSRTVTTIQKPKKLDVPDLNAFLAKDEMTIAGGYGPLKESSFRIGHMGETTLDDIDFLLSRIDEYVDS